MGQAHTKPMLIKKEKKMEKIKCVGLCDTGNNIFFIYIFVDSIVSVF